MNAPATDDEINSAIMEVALSLDEPSTREEFLDRVFAGRGNEKMEMIQLLDAADGAAAFFLEAREQRAKVTANLLAETPAPRQAPMPRFIDEDCPPEILGPYRLISRLGAGGGGVVYEAEQEHPIRRRVAVKILRMDVENRNSLARFDIERQAVALMDHPNIAKVHDAGTTPSGQPYFAMELVTGDPITLYCDRHKLGCRERLELFVQVCNAVQHAHQKGIIHRDIKPSNVIVTRQDGEHVPKIIDFGIAKPVGASRGETITAHDQFFGTPAYMSPEQVALTGIDVDTRSDIFSLGVLLYELLTGSTPTERAVAPDVTFSQIRRSLLTWDMLQPSEHLGKCPAARLKELSAARNTDPASLIAAVKGDLDWIVMMALEKNRMRRYQTANGLAIDIRRFLTDQPIAARPPSGWYVLAKFIRRNRLACGSAVLFVLLLVAGLAVTGTLYDRERKAAIELLRLKDEAQEARNEENRLRRQADARANIARAAFLLDQGRIDEADVLRQEYPLSSIEPSLEAAAVFRSLGDWNAEHGRRDQALQCFRLLRQANRQDAPQKILNGDDLMAIAAGLLRESKDEYVAFREEVLDRYTPAADAHKAEHLLKVCLIHPADAGILEKLSRDAETIGHPDRAPCPAWAAFSLSLYHLRRGDPALTLEACRTGLGRDDAKSSCVASLEAVSAMAHALEGDRNNAEASLARAIEIDKRCAGRDFARGEMIRPYWFDWANARLVIREAEERILGNPG